MSRLLKLIIVPYRGYFKAGSHTIWYRSWFPGCLVTPIIQMEQANQNFHWWPSLLASVTMKTNVGEPSTCKFDLYACIEAADADTKDGRVDTGSEGVRKVPIQVRILR